MTHISSQLTPYSGYFERILPTGSRVICNPPPEGTDEDYIVLVFQDNLATLESNLNESGWILGGSPGEFNPSSPLNTFHTVLKDGSYSSTNLFRSYKAYENPGYWIYDNPEEDGLDTYVEPSGNCVNVIVTCNEEYFDDFTRATFLCKRLNLLEKQDRITVFEALTRNHWPSDNEKKKKWKSPWSGKRYEMSADSTVIIGSQHIPVHPDDPNIIEESFYEPGSSLQFQGAVSTSTITTSDGVTDIW
jgi:hypothetical protein